MDGGIFTERVMGVGAIDAFSGDEVRRGEKEKEWGISRYVCSEGSQSGSRLVARTPRCGTCGSVETGVRFSPVAVLYFSENNTVGLSLAHSNAKDSLYFTQKCDFSITCTPKRNCGSKRSRNINHASDAHVTDILECDGK